MHRITYDKKTFSPGILFRDLGFLIAKAPALFRAMRSPYIERAFTG